jgi:hypothetical protein
MGTKHSRTQKFVEMMPLVCSRRPDPISIVAIASADPCPREVLTPQRRLGVLGLVTRRGPLREGRAGLRDADGQGESHGGRRWKVLMRWFGVGAVLILRWALVAYN